MDVTEQIQAHFDSQPEAKCNDMLTLHRLFTKLYPQGKLWFLDGINDEGKVVTNPNIGYGSYTIHYTNGTSREFYQVGMSANTTGISVYIMGIKDKNYLKEAYAKELGKASVTGYCIKFKKLSDIRLETLEAAIQYRANLTE